MVLNPRLPNASPRPSRPAPRPSLPCGCPLSLGNVLTPSSVNKKPHLSKARNRYLRITLYLPALSAAHLLLSGGGVALWSCFGTVYLQLSVGLRRAPSITTTDPTSQGVRLAQPTWSAGFAGHRLTRGSRKSSSPAGREGQRTRSVLMCLLRHPPWRRETQKPKSGSKSGSGSNFRLRPRSRFRFRATQALQRLVGRRRWGLTSKTRENGFVGARCAVPLLPLPSPGRGAFATPSEGGGCLSRDTYFGSPAYLAGRTGADRISSRHRTES